MNKIKTITATALTVLTILGSSPVTSMAVTYNRPYGPGDFWRIGNASDFRNCNNFSRVVDVGDANEDGSINLADVITIRNVVRYGYSAPEPNNWDARLRKFFNGSTCTHPDHMDVNGDGAVTSRDADILQSYFLYYGL